MEEEKQQMHFDPPVIPRQYPWLAIFHKEDSQWRTFFDLSDNRYYIKVIPDMDNKRIVTCSYGWLVLEDLDSCHCYLFNPNSMEKVQLPSLTFDYRSCVLSSPPRDPNCHILFFDRKKHVFFCQPGDDKFIEQEYEFGEHEFLFDAIMFEGKIYCLTSSYTLVTFDFMDVNTLSCHLEANYQIDVLVQNEVSTMHPKLKFAQLTMEAFRWPAPPEFCRGCIYLVESCGELLFVHKMFYGFRMEEVYGFLVFRMDFSRKTWVKVESIGEQTIFLSTNRGISCSVAKSGIKRNSIYFIENDYDRCFYVFDLEDDSISMSLPCPTISRFNSLLDWVMVQSS